MNLTIQRKLDEEYTKTLEEVSLARTGSEEAKWVLQKLTELHKQMMEETQASDKGYIELQKLHLEERETKLKEQQAQEGRVWNIVKIVIDGVAIVLPIWASWVWMGPVSYTHLDVYKRQTVCGWRILCARRGRTAAHPAARAGAVVPVSRPTDVAR